MKWFKELNDWQQAIVMIVVGPLTAYFVSWILSPYSQDIADFNCGLNVLVGLACSNR